ncbi:hypothetical protein [Comamonas sp. lk]|uniref:hypothetical protein n=1 Tax=Comamonas sp. lk TaxID=2201272 RepID=UPI0013CEFAB3|nr:hypothetical protein [Comamonas sp. lk]
MSGQGKVDNYLEKSITRWQWGIGIYVVLNILIYFGWFKIINNFNLALSADVWGQAGDFFGGILNPVVALAAFFWLTKGVRLQKEELAATRLALDESAKSQKLQEKHAAISVRIDALTGLINSILTEVTMHRTFIWQMNEAIDKGRAGVRDATGTWVSIDSAQASIASVNSRIGELMLLRHKYENELKRILESTEDASKLDA